MILKFHAQQRSFNENYYLYNIFSFSILHFLCSRFRRSGYRTTFANLAFFCLSELPNSSPKASPKNKNSSKTNNEKSTPLKQTTVAPAPKKRTPASTLPGPAANANSSNVTKRKALSRLTYPHHPRLKNEIARSEANGKASSMTFEPPNVTSTKDADKETGKDLQFVIIKMLFFLLTFLWLYFFLSLRIILYKIIYDANAQPF